jgi:hypothetical protein
MSGPRVIILKTDSGNIEGVRKHAKHATDVPPRHLEPGDLILIQVTVLPSNNPAPVIRYVMEYVRCYEDLATSPVGSGEGTGDTSWRGLDSRTFSDRSTFVRTRYRR